MGKPEDSDGFGLIQCDDIELYVAPEIWRNIEPRTEKMLIVIEGYGRFWLYFENE